MKITCNLASLKAAFHVVAPFSSSRSPKAVLQNVKLDCPADGAPSLTATDMETGVGLNLEGIEVHKPGTILLPVANFASILRESSGETMTITATDKAIEVVCNRSRFKIPVTPPDEFPSLPSPTLEKYHVIDSEQLVTCINRTEFAADPAATRYALGGLLFELTDTMMFVVATDGRRLVKCESAARSVEGHRSSGAIVRVEAIRLIARALAGGKGDVSMIVRTNECFFVTPNATFYARLLEGRFPKWRDVFPGKRYSVKVEVDGGQLHSGIRQAAIMTNKESRGITFRFTPLCLSLESNTAEVGQSTVELATSYTGPDAHVDLDFRFVTDFLKAIDSEAKATMDIEGPESAVVMTYGDSYSYVIMPLTRDR